MNVMSTGDLGAGATSFDALADLDQAAFDAMPQAVYLCAGDGRIVRFNRRAAELWGRAPAAGDPSERFCGSFRMYRTDGTWLPHDQCPMAIALQTGEPFRNQEVIVEWLDGRRLTVLVNIAALKDDAGRINGAINCFQDITDRKQAEDRHLHLIEELNHRIKNTLATVHSMAALTARDASSIDEFAERFGARLQALGRAHRLLSEGPRSGAKLRDLLTQQLEPLGGEENARVRMDGPDVDLRPRDALALSMIFHELMTNAAKYGALSLDGGHIAVAWELLSGAQGSRVLALRWAETDGPPVVAPQRRGFGTRLIEQTIALDFDGQAKLLFEPPGLRFTARIPLRG